jgi:hypothetical protein
MSEAKRNVGGLFPTGGLLRLSLHSVHRENHMSDQHQVLSIIATAIYESRKDRPEGGMDPEGAKQIAKCIVEALSDAGLRILPMSDS